MVQDASVACLNQLLQVDTTSLAMRQIICGPCWNEMIVSIHVSDTSLHHEAIHWNYWIMVMHKT